MTTTDRPAGRQPVQVGILLGLSTAAYAAALAGVAGLQSGIDRAVIDDRQPALDALAALTEHDDRLAAELDRARAIYDGAAGAYGPLAGEVADLDVRLAELSEAVARVTRASAALPARAPIVRSVAPARATARPTSHAKTGASGAR